MKNLGELDFETNAGVFRLASDWALRREDLDAGVGRRARRAEGHAAPARSSCWCANSGP